MATKVLKWSDAEGFVERINQGVRDAVRAGDSGCVARTAINILNGAALDMVSIMVSLDSPDGTDEEKLELAHVVLNESPLMSTKDFYRLPLEAAEEKAGSVNSRIYLYHDLAVKDVVGDIEAAIHHVIAKEVREQEGSQSEFTHWQLKGYTYQHVAFSGSAPYVYDVLMEDWGKHHNN
jgi:hypothetical protein